MASAVCLWSYFARYQTPLFALSNSIAVLEAATGGQGSEFTHLWSVNRKLSVSRVPSVTETEWLTFCRLSSPQRRTRCWVAGVSAHVHTLPSDINNWEPFKSCRPISQLDSVPLVLKGRFPRGSIHKPRCLSALCCTVPVTAVAPALEAWQHSTSVPSSHFRDLSSSGTRNHWSCDEGESSKTKTTDFGGNVGLVRSSTGFHWQLRAQWCGWAV